MFCFTEKTMANEQNLLKGKATQFKTGEEQAKIARKGGIASGKAKRERKLIKDRILERMGETDWDEMIDGLIERSKDSVKDFEVLRDTIGEKPKDQIEVTAMDINVVLDDED